jgi:hypothetical protein
MFAQFSDICQRQRVSALGLTTPTTQNLTCVGQISRDDFPWTKKSLQLNDEIFP